MPILMMMLKTVGHPQSFSLEQEETDGLIDLSIEGEKEEEELVDLDKRFWWIYEVDGVLSVCLYYCPDNYITDYKVQWQWTTHLNFFLSGSCVSLPNKGTVEYIGRIFVNSFQIYSFRVGTDVWVRPSEELVNLGPFLFHWQSIKVGCLWLWQKQTSSIDSVAPFWTDNKDMN